MFIFLDEFCEGFPHRFTPTPGYWIECSRQSCRGRSWQDSRIQEESQEDSSQEITEDDQQANSTTHKETADVQANVNRGVPPSTDRNGKKIQLVHQHIQVPVNLTFNFYGQLIKNYQSCSFRSFFVTVISYRFHGQLLKNYESCSFSIFFCFVVTAYSVS